MSGQREIASLWRLTGGHRGISTFIIMMMGSDIGVWERERDGVKGTGNDWKSEGIVG
jgi:hypothetical protein